MTVFNVTWVREPRRGEVPPNRQTPLYDAARFRSELERQLGIAIASVDGLLHEVDPGHGFVIVESLDDPAWSISEVEETRRQEVAARTVLMSVSPTKILERVLEPFSLAGAIDAFSLAGWNRGKVPGAQGLYGFRELAAEVGAECGPFESARYCVYDSHTHQGLPHLLADYLRALAEHL